MRTEPRSPHDLFYSNLRLVVPLFQRPYVWSRDDQWEPLWDDIVRLHDLITSGDTDATHFFGAVVLQTQTTGLGSLQEFTVIDGQQRLTTLQILLDALHAQLEPRGLTSLAGRVITLVENAAAFRQKPEDRFKVWPTNRDRPAFTAAMTALTPVDYAALPTGRLVQAHRYFSEAIAVWLDSDPESLAERAAILVPAITDRLQVVAIQLDAGEDAQEIFETLNARGTPLTAADLIKNFIFQRFDGDPDATEQAYQSYWAEFETPFWEEQVTAGRIKYARSALFLTQWLTARTLKEIPAREVFSQFKRYVIDTGIDTIDLLQAISSAASKYRAFTEGAAARDGVLSRLDLFVYRTGTLDSELTKPLLIWLAQPEQFGVADESRDRLLGILESWFVRRALVRVQSGGNNRLLLDLLIALSRRPEGGDVAEAASTFLASQKSSVGYWPDDDEIRRELAGIEAYRRLRRGRLRMVLEAVEDTLRGFAGGRAFTVAPVTRGVCTIEHILPQEWRANWHDGIDQEDEAERDRIVHVLGNLTLVTQSLNASLSNAAWTGPTGKRAALIRNDTLLLTRDVVHEHPDAWTDDDITARTATLTESILEIWPVPSGHVGTTNPAIERAQYRTEIIDLVRAGLLPAGSMLHAKPAAHRGNTATVQADGTIEMGGNIYATVSGAARALQGGGAVAGWVFWCTDDSLRRTLANVRSDYARTAL